MMPSVEPKSLLSLSNPLERESKGKYKITHLAPVVQTLDSAIHRINNYPVDKYLGKQLRYPLDRFLSGG